MSKEDDRIIVQLPTDFSEAAEQLLKKNRNDSQFTARNFIKNIRSY